MPYTPSVKYKDEVPTDIGAMKSNWWRPKPTAKEERDNPLLDIARANSLISDARRLENVQKEVHDLNLWNAQLYSNRELASFDWGTGQLYRASLTPIAQVGENLVQMVVDTMVSLVGKNRPKATPVARGASWKLRRQIRRLDKFLFGEFLRNDVYEIGKQAFRDACLFGFGCTHVHVEDDEEVGKRVCIERVFPDEIIVDQAEAVATGKIWHLYRRRVLPVEVIADMFGVDEDEICDVANEDFSYLDYRPVGKGWAVLVEGWQLCRGKRAGKYMAAVKGMPPLAEDEWKHDWFPFIFFHYQDKISGFYRQSAVEQALHYQIRLNEINEVIADAQDLAGRMRLLVAKGSQVNPDEFDNKVARILTYTGIKPEAVTWPAVSAELYNERDRLVVTCKNQFGLNEMSTSGTPPPAARFDSSAAFREANAIQDNRLSDVAQRFEKYYLDIAMYIIKCIRANGASPKTTWYSGGKKARAETIDWDQINIEDEAYVLQLQASSIFNLTPAGQRDELEKQLAQQIISPEEYRQQLANPDLESEASIHVAAAEDLKRVIELFEDGKYESSESAQDLANGVQLVSLAYLNAKSYEDVEDEVLLGMLNWISAAKSILKRATEPQPDENTAPMDPSRMGVPTPGPGGGMVSPAVPAAGGPDMTPMLPMPGGFAPGA